ncbi:sensor histidine kinase [Paenibacillus solisilvae]|uniref:histidine kinase n=1 Tax=Paenibacillus solisilvae TaxID=2486751 RepID=A0ABW0VWT1_9BACL
MSFILMAVMSLVPLFLGLSSKVMFKTKLTNAMVVFMIFMSLWQLDVSFLYSVDIFSQETIFFLFKCFRIGSIMLPPAFLYVGYVALKYLSDDKKNWMRWIINRYTIIAYYLWSLFIYLINWSSLGVLGLKKIHGLGGANFVLYPLYGEWSFLFAYHIKLLIVSILLTLLASRKVIDKYVKFFLTLFSLAFILTYVVGVLNLKPATFIYSSQIAVMFFSIFVFFIFVNMSTKMIKETSRILNRKEQEKQIEMTTTGLIHEIKNPLTIVKGYSDLLARDKKLDQTSQGMVNNIQIAGSHMNSIVSNYKDFIASGKLNIEETDILEIVKESISLTSIRAGEENISIHFREGKSIKAKIDKDKIRQVFINLINNSIEAMQGKKQKIIKIRIKRRNNDIHLVCTDTGSGIPEEKWKQIFSPFQSSKEAGRGLGLSICQRIINSHGGNIEIARSSEKGTEIRISIPIVCYEQLMLDE